MLGGMHGGGVEIWQWDRTAKEGRRCATERSGVCPICAWQPAPGSLLHLHHGTYLVPQHLFRPSPRTGYHVTGWSVLCLLCCAVQGTLAYLYQIIEARLASYHSLLALAGRLDVVLAHAQRAAGGGGAEVVGPTPDAPLVSSAAAAVGRRAIVLQPQILPHLAAAPTCGSAPTRFTFRSSTHVATLADLLTSLFPSGCRWLLRLAVMMRLKWRTPLELQMAALSPMKVRLHFFASVFLHRGVSLACILAGRGVSIIRWVAPPPLRS